MACEAIFDNMPAATEHLSKHVYYVASRKNIFLNLVPKETFNNNVGLEQTGFVAPRIEPTTDEETWDEITLVTQNNDQGACAKVREELTSGMEVFTYKPIQKHWWGEVICRDDLAFVHDPERWISNFIIRNANQVQNAIGNQYQKQYGLLSRKAVCVDAASGGLVITDPGSPMTGLPLVTQPLTQDRLEFIAAQLAIDNGDTEFDTNQFVSSGPVGALYSLGIGLQASLELQRLNSTFRTDLQFAYQGKMDEAPLMMRLGARIAIGNFRHVPMVFPPRYTQDAGTGDVTRVNTFVNVTTTKGVKSVPNPAWLTAPIEGAYILHPRVMTAEIVRPVNTAGGATFDPANWAGEPRWVVGAYKWDGSCSDPAEDRGRHLWSYRCAFRKEHPELGYLILFKRCRNVTDPETCVSPS